MGFTGRQRGGRMGLETGLNRYAEITREIRVLSSVQRRNVTGVDEYSVMLGNDFCRIGELADESRGILENELYPLLDSAEIYNDGTAAILQNFCHSLLDPFSEEELDLSMLYKVSKRLLYDAQIKKDDNYLVSQLYIHINACYANVNRANRIRVTDRFIMEYQRDGIAAAGLMLQYLRPDKLRRLNQKNRGRVMTHSRFYLALYDTFMVTPEINAERISGLWKSFELSNDKAVSAMVNGFDWNYHRIRCLENMGQLTERGNEWGFTSEQCGQIMKGVRLLGRIWDEKPEDNSKILPSPHLELIKARNSFFNGELKTEDYRKALLGIYRKYANDRYDMYSVQANLFIPVEYLVTFEKTVPGADEQEILYGIYMQMVHYILKSVNTESYYFLLEYLSGILDHFVDIPGKYSFLELGLQCLAALHPPTLVHSLQVAGISRRLCEYMIEMTPEKLIGTMGTKSADDVRLMREQILRHIYNGGLCHDFGKIFIMDTIFCYGRKLFDTEFEFIKLHPLAGAEILSRHESTKEYADIARGHHVWYDRTAGYPDDFDIAKSSDRVLIDIIAVADSIDAATDAIGRSYNKGKTFETVADELHTGSGTRYSPDVVCLLNDTGIFENIKDLLYEGREQNYRRSYQILS